MPVTDVQMELLRAHIAGEEDAVGLARNQMSSTEGLGALVRAAFAVAARRRFYPSWTSAQVILFVGRVRALCAERRELVDAPTAERELRRALGEQVPASGDVPASASAQLLMLDVLIAELNLDDLGVAGLLTQARELADQTLAAAGL